MERWRMWRAAYVAFLAMQLAGCGTRQATAYAPLAAQSEARAGVAQPSPVMAATAAGEPAGAPAPALAVVSVPEKTAAPSAAGTNNVPSVADAPQRGAMLVYTASLDLAVFQLEQQMNHVEALARDAGGYLSIRNDKEITIRVPRAKFDDVLRGIEKLGDVLHRNVSAQDVTDEYVDIDARIRNARAVRDRLQALLQKAEVKEAIEIQKELARVTQELEVLEGKFKLLEDRIAFSTIRVGFQPVTAEVVHDPSILPFPWLKDLGLSTLLDVEGRGRP